MNSPFATPQVICAILATILFLAPAASHAELSDAERIASVELLSTPIGFFGETPPPLDESRALWQALERCSARAGEKELEKFVERYPLSAWTPSVRAHLAQLCRQKGRYTVALQQWELAWAATKHHTNGVGRTTADFTLAYWSSLLASLGRHDRLSEIFKETSGRTLERQDWDALFRQAQDGCHTMKVYAGISYRCGTFALHALGRALNPTNRGLDLLFDIPSPTNGFSMTRLAEIAESNKMALLPVNRKGSTNIIVPSVVHWRQDHYAAIVRQHASVFLVVDPTFGSSKWMTAEVINEEASGNFMVPKSLIPTNWVVLAKAETDTIRGKGQQNHINDWQDEGCDRAPGGPGAAAPSSLNAGGNNSICVPCDSKGMPVWWVSEPYINLHISDTPLSYGLSDGTEWAFRWSYKQRDVYNDPSSGFCGSTFAVRRDRGMTNATWSHNWLSHIRYVDSAWDAFPTGNPGYTNFSAYLYLSEGGVRHYENDLFSVGNGVESRSQVHLVALSGNSANAPAHAVNWGDQFTNGLSRIDDSTNGFKLVYPDGSEDFYSLTRRTLGCINPHSDVEAFLTKRVSPQKHTNYIVYEFATNVVNDISGIFRPKYVIDPDGRTNVFTYSTVSQKGEELLSVSNAYGFHADFNYYPDGRLYHVADAAGLSSAFGYESGSNGWINVLATPYGNTTFGHYQVSQSDNGVDQDNAGGHNRVNRFIQVTEPDGGTQVFMYRYDTAFLPASYPTNQVPSLPPYPAFLPPTFDNGSASSAATDASLHFRNSFYWGKKQYAALSTTAPLSFNSNDYVLARTRHWLSDSATSGNNPIISDRLSIERAPSPDGITEGAKTWYDYPYKSSTHRLASYGGYVESLVQTVARVLPDGTTQFSYHQYSQSTGPYPSKRHTSYTTPFGTNGYRAEQFGYVGTNLVDLRQITYSDGTTDRFGYNQFHQVTAHTNTAQEATRFSYTGLPFSRLSSITNANGLVTQFNYNSTALGFTNHDRGMLQSVVQSQIGRTNSFTWTNGQPLTITDARGMTVTNTSDGLQRLITVASRDGVISNRYDKLDLFATKDRVGNWTYFAHDAMQRVTGITNANTNVTVFGYCGCGALQTISDTLSTNTFNYDFQLNRTNAVLADGTVLNYRFDPFGRVTDVLYGTNRTWQLEYNNQGLLASVSNAFGQVERIVYDVRDRPLRVTDSAGVTITNSFDNLGRVLSRAFPDGGIERFLYTTNGLVAYTNQLTIPTRYSYDLGGRVTAITNGNLEVTRFTYNAADDLLTLVNGNNRTNRWNYDSFGRATNKVDGNGVTNAAFSYDANGRLTNRWTPAKGDTGFQYDPVGNLKSIQYPTPSTVTLQYDALNRMTNLVDSVGTTTFTYSPSGQLLAETMPWIGGGTVTYTYANRLRASLAHASWTNSYGFDAARRLTNVTSGAGSFGYGFVGASSLTRSLALPNAAVISNSFDAVAQLTNTALASASALLSAHGYGYDTAGQRTRMDRLAGTPGTPQLKSFLNYTYDNIGQLKTAWGYETNTTHRLHERMSYGYDSAGNLSYRTNDVNVQTFTVDRANQLTNVARAGLFTASGLMNTPAYATNVTVNGTNGWIYSDNTYAAEVAIVDGTNTFTAIGAEVFGRRATNTVTANLPLASVLRYDLNGNLTNDGRRSFSYDAENQLTNVVVANSWMSAFSYDGLGRRRTRTEYTWTNGTWYATNTTRYVYDGMLVLRELDQNNTPKATYTRGLDLSHTLSGAGGIGGLLARTYANGSAFYHSDASGNVIAMTDALQSIVARYTYDSFGNLLYSSGSLAQANLYRFSSEEVHALSGLVLYPFRPYSPSLQRPIQADPIGVAGGFNVHRFVGNDPLNRVDPWGFYDGNFNRPPVELNWDVNFTPLFPGSPLSITSPIQRETEYNSGPRFQPDETTAMIFSFAVSFLVPVPGTTEANIARVAAQRAACKTAQVATKGGKEIVQRAMSRAELAATESSGLLRGGRSGTHHVSDAVNSTAGRAQQRLALPKTPEIRATLEVPSGRFSPPSRVQPNFNMPGGGMERTASGNVPVRVLRVDEY